MDRKSRRFEIRQIIRELKNIKTHRVYTEALKNEVFSAIVAKDLQLLKEGIHPDSAIQMKYGKAINLLAQIVQLEKRLQYLQVGFREVSEQTVPTI
jgi:hypothetical protein